MCTQGGMGVVWELGDVELGTIASGAGDRIPGFEDEILISLRSFSRYGM